MKIRIRWWFIILLSILWFFSASTEAFAYGEQVPWWEVQSMDTMKFSRDLSRENLHDSTFDSVIDMQVKNIAQTGATHVAIGTPYDEEFLPILKRWVEAARRYDINVWFRGNFSGWEGWFGYKSINREDHIVKTRDFILSNPGLFMNGDIFTPCPECENGGPGDPRRTGDVEGFRKFLIDEYQVTKEAFKQIEKDVKSNYNSMNRDVALLVMDKRTTEALGGVVVIDHFLYDPDQLAKDIKEIALKSRGRVVLGEFGVPIPDIHGNLTGEEQADWINRGLSKLVKSAELLGVNYWVSVGGSTELWYQDGTAKPAVEIFRKFFEPKVATGFVKNKSGEPIVNAKVKSAEREAVSDSSGYFELPYFSDDLSIRISKVGYISQEVNIPSDEGTLRIVLETRSERILSQIQDFIRYIFKSHWLLQKIYNVL